MNDPLAFFRNLPAVTKNLFLVCAIVGVASFVASGQGYMTSQYFGIYYWGLDQFNPYQLVTSIFVHSGLAHFALNMFGLVMFGALLERLWGAKRFFIFYIVCGIGASIIANLTNGIIAYFDYEMWTYPGVVFEGGYIKDVQHILPEWRYTSVFVPSVGASGALYGLLAAVWRLFPNLELQFIFIPIPVKAKYFVPFILALDLFLGVSQFDWDNIGHFAHLGGALIGFIFVTIWQRNKKTFY